MNTNIVIIIFLVVVIGLLTYQIFYNKSPIINIITSQKEGFSSDEAIQNVASLYNQGKLEVTDFTSTGIATLNTANIANVNAQSITDSSVGSTVKAMRDNLQGQITALKTYVEGPLTEWIKGQDDLRVLKAKPFTLTGTWTFEGKNYNGPVGFSDNFNLRGYDANLYRSTQFPGSLYINQ